MPSLPQFTFTIPKVDICRITIGTVQVHNILLSHSDGGGFFKYLTEDGSIETMNDPAGWNAKVGYYGAKMIHNQHCAGSTSPRQTIGFVIPDKDMWEMMIEDISYA